MKFLLNTLVFLFLFSGSIHAQFDKKEQIIIKAMQDQLKTSMDSLKLNNFPRPKFIQYAYKKGETNVLRYNRGALYEEELARPISLIRTDLIIEDEQGINSHNFSQRGFVLFPRMGESQDVVPIEPDYDEIKRVFWWLSDVQYKNAINEYEGKKRKMTDPALTENIKKDMVLPDFPALPKTEYYESPAQNPFDKEYWNNLLAEVSDLYNKNEGLYDLSARIESSCNNIYTVNSEGTIMRHAITNMTLNIGIVAENKNKERFAENLVFTGFTAKDIPSEQEIMTQVQKAINLVLNIVKAEAADKDYFGPAIIDAPLVSAQMFGGLSASRIPVSGNMHVANNNNNLGVRMYSSNISVETTPTMKEYEGKRLFGSYAVDGEGVRPKEKLTLVEKGVLKQLLNDRVPTSVTPESTGSNVYMAIPNVIARLVMPGVIHINCADQKSSKDLKTELIQYAKEMGLQHAFIIKRLKNGNTDWYYRVDLENGVETLVRGYSINLNNNKPLRRIIASSDNTDVFHINYMGTNNSVISPDEFLLEEVNISKPLANRNNFQPR